VNQIAQSRTNKREPESVKYFRLPWLIGRDIYLSKTMGKLCPLSPRRSNEKRSGVSSPASQMQVLGWIRYFFFPVFLMCAADP
jgi:hypothetical protein